MKWEKNSLLLIRGPLCLIACMLSCVWLFVTHQSPLSMGFPRQEYWIGLSFLPPGESSWPRDQTCGSCGSCIGRQILYHWATWELRLCLITKYLKVGNWGKSNERNVNKLFLHLNLFKILSMRVLDLLVFPGQESGLWNLVVKQPLTLPLAWCSKDPLTSFVTNFTVTELCPDDFTVITKSWPNQQDWGFFGFQ